MNITIIGTGYLGLTTAGVMTASGHKVYCLDINPEVINSIKKGKPHFFEPGLDRLVEAGIKSGNLIPTLDYSLAIPDSEISLICVNTPSDDEGNLSLKYVESAAREMSKHIRTDHIIILKSTVPVGTSEIITSLIKSQTDVKFNYVSNPEFLAESSAVLDTMFPDRIVVGTDSDFAYQKVYEMYEQVDKFAQNYDKRVISEYSKTYRIKFSFNKKYSERVQRVSIPSAELIKVTANSFLATKISFANAVARIADANGADISEVMDSLGSDPRIGRDFLYAGLGWGGGCFPKDLDGLIKSAADKGYDFELLRAVVNTNSDQIDFAIKKVKEILSKVPNIQEPTITILGLSFKPGTSDIRVSPAIRLLDQLEKYYKNIKVYDPEAMENARRLFETDKNTSNATTSQDIVFCSSTYDAVKDSDLLLLATEWPEFLNTDYTKIFKLMRNPNILDARNRLDSKKLKKPWFYISRNRPQIVPS